MTKNDPTRQYNQRWDILPKNIVVEQIMPIAGEGFLVRLYNPSLSEVEVLLPSNRENNYLYFCDPEGRNRQPVSLQFNLMARDVMHIFIEQSIE
jgi:hypothetical protein